MDINNIQLIDQRLAHHCTLIPQYNAQSAAAETRFPNETIILKIKRIEAINALEMRLVKL